MARADGVAVALKSHTADRANCVDSAHGLAGYGGDVEVLDGSMHGASLCQGKDEIKAHAADLASGARGLGNICPPAFEKVPYVLERCVRIAYRRRGIGATRGDSFGVLY
jgi:hypothetical protein